MKRFRLDFIEPVLPRRRHFSGTDLHLKQQLHALSSIMKTLAFGILCVSLSWLCWEDGKVR